jgi:hypothetical protein
VKRSNAATSSKIGDGLSGLGGHTSYRINEPRARRVTLRRARERATQPWSSRVGSRFKKTLQNPSGLAAKPDPSILFSGKPYYAHVTAVVWGVAVQSVFHRTGSASPLSFVDSIQVATWLVRGVPATFGVCSHEHRCGGNETSGPGLTQTSNGIC